jgi:predicted nucleic acid-binding protein
MLRVSDHLLDAAGRLPAATMRPLDAIHLATTQRLGRDLGTVITYDERMIEAASEIGLKTINPT